MRLGIDCRMYSSNFTGIGRYTHELVDHLISHNDSLPNPHKIVLFFNKEEFNNANFTSPNVEKIEVSAKHYSLAEQTSFLKALYQARLDHAHFPHFNVPLLYRKSYTVTIHDLTLSLYPGKKMNQWYYRLAYNLILKNAISKAKHILSVSENTKKDLLKLTNLKEGKISVAHIGVSEIFQKLDSSKEEYISKTLNKYNIKKPFLLYTGVWRSHKNLPRLFKAFAKLIDKNQDLQLVITGKEDPFYPEVKETVKKLKLEDKVIFPGLVSEEELVHLYNAARVYVFPSLYEGFGLPPLEAMACGTAVVASNISSIPEVCQEAALYFDPSKVDEIHEKLKQMLSSSDLRNEFIKKGNSHYKTFSWEKCMKKSIPLILDNLK